MSTWPVGCHSPNSCARHRRCMYVRCRHETDQDLKSDIDKAVATEEALRPVRKREALRRLNQDFSW